MGLNELLEDYCRGAVDGFHKNYERISFSDIFTRFQISQLLFGKNSVLSFLKAFADNFTFWEPEKPEKLEKLTNCRKLLRSH